jgi:hypothetical protein
MSMGYAGSATLAFGRAAPEPSHLSGSATFINKNKAFRIKIELALEPTLPRKPYIGALLF